MKEAGAEAYEMWKSLSDVPQAKWSEDAKIFMDDDKLPKTEEAWKSYLSDIDDSYESAATKYNQVIIPL